MTPGGMKPWKAWLVAALSTVGAQTIFTIIHGKEKLAATTATTALFLGFYIMARLTDWGKS